MKTKRAVVDREMTAKREEMAAKFRALLPPEQMTPTEKAEFELEFAHRMATLDDSIDFDEFMDQLDCPESSKKES